MAWDFGGAFAQGYDIGDRMAQRKRQSRMDEREQGRYAEEHRLAREARDRASAYRAEDIGFKEREEMRKGSESTADISEKMAKADVSRGALPSENKLREAQAYRLMNPVAKSEQDAAALRESGLAIADIGAHETALAKQSDPEKLWGTRWFRSGPQLPPEEAAMRDKLEQLRMDALQRHLGQQPSVGDRMAVPSPGKKQGGDGTVVVVNPKTGESRRVKDSPEVRSRINTGVLKLGR